MEEDLQNMNKKELLKKYPELLIEQIFCSYMSMGFIGADIEKLEKNNNPSEEVLEELEQKKIDLKQKEIEFEASKKVLKSINNDRPDISFNFLIYKQLYKFENDRYLSLRAKETSLHAILRRQQNYLSILIVFCTLVVCFILFTR